MGENPHIKPGESGVLAVISQWIIASTLMALQHRPVKAREKDLTSITHCLPLLARTIMHH